MVNHNEIISFEELKKLAEFIKKQTGITLEKDKLQRLKKRIELLFAKYDIKSFSSFYHQIRFAKNETLLQELINTVTVNETYFWREHEQIVTLANEILPRIAQQKKHIRILVAPTSSGEELYSIMFAIMQEKNVIQTTNIEMVGIDIDSNVIRKAKVGLYTKRSVEKLPKHMLESYFKRVGEFYQLDSSFINAAQFIQANIFDPDIEKKLGFFDVVFSRNMMIYFDKEEKQKAFSIFYNLLQKDGYLFLGHADANGLDKTKFKPLKRGLNIFQKV
jgi:chemotaxis protein methyltransferase CheR